MNALDRIRADLAKLKGKPGEPDEIVLHPATAALVKKQVTKISSHANGATVKISTDFFMSKTVAGLKRGGKLIGKINL